MSETAEKSSKHISSTGASECNAADSQEKSLESSKTEDKIDSDSANTAASLQTNPDTVTNKEEIMDLNPLPKLTKPILDDEAKDTCKHEETTSCKDSNSELSSQEMVLQYDNSENSKDKSSDPVNDNLPELTKSTLIDGTNDTGKPNVSISLNDSASNNFKDSDPCSEDFVLRYDESESDLDQTNVNNDSSQNVMDGSNDNIIEELDKIIAEDNGNSDLDTKDDGEFITMDNKNEMILPEEDKCLGSSLTAPVLDPIADENTINEPENKCGDETDKAVMPEVEMTKEINVKVQKQQSEPNILEKINLKIPETALVGAGDGFISEAIPAANFVKFLETDVDITHSIIKNQETVTKEAINTVLPTADDSFNSGCDDKMDIDGNIAPIMPKAVPMEVTNNDTIASIESSNPVTPTLAKDSKSTKTVADQAIDDEMETVTSDSCNTFAIIAGIDNLERDASKNIELSLNSLDVCELSNLYTGMGQDHEKELIEPKILEMDTENFDCQAHETSKSSELEVAPVDDRIDSAYPASIKDEPTSSEIISSLAKYSEVVPEISANVPKDSNDKIITESGVSLSEHEERALIKSPDMSLLLTKEHVSPTDSNINIAASPEPIDKKENNVPSLTDQKEQDITSKNVIKDFKPGPTEPDVSNAQLANKDNVEMPTPETENNTKVTDQLSVVIPKFSTKKSDISKEVVPQALQLSERASKPKDTESEVTLDKYLSKDVIDSEITQPELVSTELDLPSCDTAKTKETKAQKTDIFKTISELKDIKPQISEITQLVSKSTESSASEIKYVLKSEESESLKAVTETKDIKLKGTEIKEEPQDLESQETETAQPSAKAEVMDTEKSESDQISTDINSKDLKLKLPEASTPKDIKSLEPVVMDTDTSETILESSDKESIVIKKDPEPKSEPCISKDFESQEMQPDQSDEVPDMTDSLGLLAESSRPMEDRDEPEDDHEEADDDDDDDDFDHDDESNQVPDNSEDSNVATNSETDLDANLGDPIKSPLLDEAGRKIDVVTTLAGTVIEAITDMDIEESKIMSAIDLDSLEQDDLKLPQTPDALSDIRATKEVLAEGAPATNDCTLLSPHLRAILTETQVPAESEKLSPTKLKKLEISKPKNFLNIVEVEESSSEDDIQVVPRLTDSEVTADDSSNTQSPAIAKSVRINTSEITIKTATAESTLVIPEIRVGNDIPKDSKPKCGLEVFSLDSDEDSSGKDKLETDSKVETKQPYLDTLKAGDCVNPKCDGTYSHYIKANAAILRFYDVKKKRRKRAVVCENCACHVGSRLENMISGVKCRSNRLLALDIERDGDQLVEISDSETDSDSENRQPNVVDQAYSFLSIFADISNSTWLKYNLATRMADTVDEVFEQIEQIEKDSKEIDEMLSSCQKLTDQIRGDLYAAFSRPIHSLPPIDIDENCVVQTPPAGAIFLNNDDSETDGSVRRSKRKRTSRDEPPNIHAAIPLPNNNHSEDPNADTKDDDIRVVRLCSESAPASLPAPGEYRRPALRVGALVFGMRQSFGAWCRAVIESVAPSDVPNFSTCRVKFENKVKGQFKQLLGRHLAYAEPADVRLTIGTRVIALFLSWSENKKKTAYYSGVIAEVPNPVNFYRYLVFFDDGYAQYIIHADIRVVCETSSLVWEEVHTLSRDFVKSYLLAYPERPMVRLHAGQSLKTEWSGKWWPSKVLSVDASLANIYFEADKRTEWIYRGSTRLAPLFLELQAAERPRHRALHSSANRHIKNMPYVEYTRTNEQEDVKTTPEAQQQQEQEEIKRQRAVAKKSTIQPYQPQPPPSVHQSPSDSVLSRVVYYTPKAAVKPLKMQTHTCSAKCKRTDVLPLNELRTYNPLARPLLSGWERQIVRFRFRKDVVYRAPCGRRLRNVQELHRYLRDTCSDMSVDLFDFNPQTHCLAEFVLNRCLVSKKDLSHGKENVPVPCVNYYDSALPEFCSYNTERTPTQGVPLNTDPEFLCGCDCTDDCQDKSKCACWKLTMEGAKTIGMEDTAGYVYKRLLEPVPTGIYECNSRCKCSKTCLNRVAQHPLQLKLQVFKTLNRGWGIRALNDVPKGAFLCVYAGNLLTDATANLDGLNEGDEYLAELDYIEVVEQMKEGYEDDVPHKDKRLDQKSSASSETSADSQSEGEDNGGGSERIKDEDFKPDPSMMGPTQHVFSKRLRKRSRKGQEGEKETERDKDKPKDKDGNEDDCITISDDEEVRQPSRFNAEAGMDPNEFKLIKKRPLRSFFGKDEACYIMDAKVQGNIGRYLNHSCTPNVFVQNVFVDTHDPRFPWVAFFALSHIKAGTELTWNYNYDIGSVPGKILYCYCGAPNCRRRLL